MLQPSYHLVHVSGIVVDVVEQRWPLFLQHQSVFSLVQTSLVRQSYCLHSGSSGSSQAIRVHRQDRSPPPTYSEHMLQPSYHLVHVSGIVVDVVEQPWPLFLQHQSVFSLVHASVVRQSYSLHSGSSGSSQAIRVHRQDRSPPPTYSEHMLQPSYHLVHVSGIVVDMEEQPW